MVIVDKELEKLQNENRMINVGMIGSGFMGKVIALQLNKYTKGIRLAAIYNRSKQKAMLAFKDSGISEIKETFSPEEIDTAVEKGQYAVAGDPFDICRSKKIDIIVEVTGAVEFSANVVLEAIRNHKHVIMMNAELDGTVGPILKVYADREGVVLSNSDGDQPGVIMNLYRYVKSLGIKPVLCGNIKGLHDPYRNPETQAGFAKKWGQNPQMVTSFADGTKISFEQAIVANATGMRVARRGMFGPAVPAGTSVKETVSLYPVNELLEGPGIVDYVVGAEPNSGVFVLGTTDDPVQMHHLNLYKVGTGPLYCFFNPYHLCHFEVPNAIARAVLFADATIAPAGPPCVIVSSAAKRDLKAGDLIDGLGGFMTYGLAENYAASLEQNLLPIGAAEGCILKRDVKKDEVLTYEDVELPAGRMIDQLLREQNSYFALNSPAANILQGYLNKSA